VRLVKRAFERLLGWRQPGQAICPEYISNAGLTPGMIPRRTAPLQEIVRFSLTFDGYWRKDSFNRCAEVPWSRDGGTLSHMRACLYHELKGVNSPGRTWDGSTESFVRDLLDRMREKVERDERD
jgi:hypothetical protein